MALVKVELTFPSDLIGEPVLYVIGRDFRVIPNILEASFSTEMGWAIVTIEGDQEEVDKVFRYLCSKHIGIKKI